MFPCRRAAGVPIHLMWLTDLPIKTAVFNGLIKYVEMEAEVLSLPNILLREHRAERCFRSWSNSQR